MGPETSIQKRDGRIVPFDMQKVVIAIQKAMNASEEGSKEAAEGLAVAVATSVGVVEGKIPTVEQIQDETERQLIAEGFAAAAKAYIIYRYEHAKNRKRDIFKKRVNLKPHEYPELLEYVDAIRHSYWIHSEFNFTGDIQDFHVHVNEAERSAIKNALLAIAQIEVSVKTFWGDIYKKMPKPEIGSVGATFAESEVRHQDAYAHLLEVLNLNDEFLKVKDIPAIMDRVSYLEDALKNARTDDEKEYTHTVLLFALFVEHVSLFSQFLIIMAFNKYKNLFKGTSNVIEATSKEEQIHGLFGIDIIKIIKEEHPEWFDGEHKDTVVLACSRAYDAESRIIDWIFEKGEFDFLPKDVVKEFVKNRFNNSLVSIGLPKHFEVDDKLLEQTEWFNDEIIGTKHGDFFVKRSINYNKRSAPTTGDDLF